MQAEKIHRDLEVARIVAVDPQNIARRKAKTGVHAETQPLWPLRQLRQRRTPKSSKRP